MSKKSLLLSLIALLVVGTGNLATASISPSENPILSKYFVKNVATVAMDKIAAEFEVELRRDGGFQVIVPAHRANELLTLAPRALLLDADMAATLHRRVGNPRASGWRDFQSVQSELTTLASLHNGIVTVEKYGESKEGRPLRALRLLTKVPSERAKPQVVITSATHGDELITVEVTLGLLQLLLQGYGKDARLTKMVDTHEIYFIPVINPDGYVRQERYCNGIDPNRNYPWPEKPDRTPNPAIKSIMDFFATHEVKGSMDYHSAAGMIMYPWAYTYDSIPAEMKNPIEKLTAKMASFNGYTHGQIAQTIYVAPGSSADYYYWKFNTKALGIEISQDGTPSLIPRMIEENRESTWTFIESF